MRLNTLYRYGLARLKEAKISEAEVDAAFLLGHLLNLNRTQLQLAGDQILPATTVTSFKQYITRRIAHEPVAYILGQQEFWSLPFIVSPAVLIPRPETELLLEIVLSTATPKEYVLDLGTGSGVIAVVLALELPDIVVYGVECSLQALQIAKINARQHNVLNQLHFINTNWLDAIKFTPQFDLIVSNPPYIASQQLALLQPEVRDFEPALALNGGTYGMESIKLITSRLSEILRPGGWFFMEIGFDQEEHVLELFNSYTLFNNVVIHKDYAGHPRILQARRLP